MAKVSRLVRENLTKRALRFNLVLDDVSITHVAFSPEFTHAVEAKQVWAPRLWLCPRFHKDYSGRTTNSSSSSFPCGPGHPGEAGMQIYICRYLYAYSVQYSRLLFGRRVRQRVQS
jgi:hypothetical protein